MLISDKKIAIIGGGPGGLTLARLLQLKGADVKVYERDMNRKVRVQGATLDLHFDSGLRTIDAAGLMDAFKATYRPGAEKGRLVDKSGNIIFDDHDKTTPATDFNSPEARPEIDRSDLRDLLLNSLHPDTVVWDSHFISMSKKGKQWKLEFKNGTTTVADIIIGADGGNSKIRPCVTSTKAVYAGIYILQGNVDNAAKVAPAMHELLKGGKLYAHSDEKYLHVSAKGDGSIDFYVSSKRNENWSVESGIDFTDKSQVAELFRTEFADWDKIWFELFENYDGALLIRPQYCIPLDQTWEAQSNITLLGDAAHIMAPSGEGVNLAMLDAVELSTVLTYGSFNDLKEAIAFYEKNMRERGAAEAATSAGMIEWMHAEGAQEKMAELLA
ncbi:FAD-dependent monooxygenase [Chryseolinea sp. T2]|uniref:FAD-dependent oxidoreductase n=1 Tax=Chryseolinea sp. T2 TaxID=3129255 RepID=UPI0030777A13